MALADEAMVDVTLPASLTPAESIGSMAFATHCSACHGTNAAGRAGMGPPLVHIIYEPGHHSDDSIRRAVTQGVRGHHWPFGDMPPVEGLDPTDLEAIIAWVRAMQRANGIN